MLIVVSGDDCSGKSTQIGLLKESLEREGKEVIISWHRPGYSRCLTVFKTQVRRIAPGALPLTEQKIARDKMFSKSVVRALWKLMAMVDLIVQRCIKLRFLLATGKIVICDRYWLDSMLDFENKFREWDGTRSLLFRVVREAHPKPDGWILLRLPWPDLVARSQAKKEPFPDSVEARRKRHDRYSGLADAGPWLVVSAGGTPDEVHKAIIERLNGRAG